MHFSSLAQQITIQMRPAYPICRVVILKALKMRSLLVSQQITLISSTNVTEIVNPTARTFWWFFLTKSCALTNPMLVSLFCRKQVSFPFNPMFWLAFCALHHSAMYVQEQMQSRMDPDASSRCYWVNQPSLLIIDPLNICASFSYLLCCS